MRSKFFISLLFVFTVFIFLLQKPFVLAQNNGATIILNPNTVYQTMEGWEATAQAGQYACNNLPFPKSPCPSFLVYKDALYDQAVNDLGINRLRLETFRKDGPAGKQTGNGFDLVHLDAFIDTLVLPIKQRLTARGEKLWVNLTVVGNGYATDPDGYATAALELVNHIKTKYGFIPDSWEIALEPDNFGWGGADNVTNTLVSTVNVFKANNLPTYHYFVIPSNTAMDNALSWYEQILNALPAKGVSSSVIGEVSYHRYGGVSTNTLGQLGNRALNLSIGGAMLEHIGSGYADLYQDLTLGRNSAWSQYTLAGPWVWNNGDDNGGTYYLIDDRNVSNPIITMGSRTKFLRQYFKFVRSGAVRIGTQTTDNNFNAVAFKNADGKNSNAFTVVVNANTGGSFTITGLPAATYGIKYTTGSEYDRDLPNITINSGQGLTASIPAAGVLTVYALSSPAPTSTPAVTSPPSCNSRQNGDANCDGVIDGIDYVIWLNSQCRPSASQKCNNISADFNNDGKVDDTDYWLWFSHRR